MKNILPLFFLLSTLLYPQNGATDRNASLADPVLEYLTLSLEEQRRLDKHFAEPAENDTNLSSSRVSAEANQTVTNGENNLRLHLEPVQFPPSLVLGLYRVLIQSPMLFETEGEILKDRIGEGGIAICRTVLRIE